MAEINGSQESLPLSQESCLHLFSLIGGPISNLIENDALADQAYNTLVNDVNRMQAATPIQLNGYSNNYPFINTQELQDENVLQQSQYKVDSNKWSSVAAGNPCENNEDIAHENFTEQQRPVSSLLGRENWPGEYSFNVSFNKQKATKGISWIFSPERNKLYVDKNFSCPVNFAANIPIPMQEEIFIRAVALFSSSEFAYEKVTRCLNHSVQDIEKNIFEAEHFIRCESKNALYEDDNATNRHSVIVPYENPPAGQEYSTYLYKFMCYGSCSGGPNRRGLMVVFTLERRNGEVLGRQKFELKVCACPVRDYNSDERKSVLKEQKPVKRRKTDFHVDSVSDFSLIEPPKRAKKESVEYVIKTTDRNRYKFLKKMENLHILYTSVKDTPYWQNYLTSSQSSSGGESELTQFFTGKCTIRK